jgi:hypothetical protein
MLIELLELLFFIIYILFIFISIVKQNNRLAVIITIFTILFLVSDLIYTLLGYNVNIL